MTRASYDSPSRAIAINTALTSIPGEEWKPYPECADYEVSSLGRVRSLKKGMPRVLHQAQLKNGYYQVSVYADGIGVRKYVHHMVIETFGPQRPSAKHRACHRDFNRDNNAAHNVIWALPADNHRQAASEGRWANAVTAQAKLTEEDVLEIRRELAAGAKHKELAARFNVSSSNISSIASGHTWRHLLGREVA